MDAMRWMGVLWPAFLAACALEALVFAFVDPSELMGAAPGLGVSRQAVYSAAFFAFWAIAAGACALTALLAQRAAALPAGGANEARPRA